MIYSEEELMKISDGGRNICIITGIIFEKMVRVRVYNSGKVIPCVTPNLRMVREPDS